MEKLTQFDNAFIRPSPSGGTLGGVARKTRETILLCEAAGFDTILIETVGVGQSEITVRSMVDFFLLILLPGGGDELQGMKKGAVELADAIAVNKADGDNERTALVTKMDYQNAVHYLMPATRGWDTRVLTCSALNDIGIKEIWQTALDFIDNIKSSGMFDSRRNDQLLEWVYSMIEEELKNRFYNHPEIAAVMPSIRNRVLNGGITPTNAVAEMLELYK
jgi:LAO/AO transport system kinase